MGFRLGGLGGEHHSVCPFLLEEAARSVRSNIFVLQKFSPEVLGSNNKIVDEYNSSADSLSSMVYMEVSCCICDVCEGMREARFGRQRAWEAD